MTEVPDEVRAQLRDSELLAELGEERCEAFLRLASVVEIPEAGVVIVREGAASENFYWIIEGEAEVSKLEPTSDREFAIAELGPGDHFGETSLFRAGNRTATVRSKTALKLGMIRARPVREKPEEHTWLAPMLFNLMQIHTRRLDRLSGQTVNGFSAEQDTSGRLAALTQLLIFAILGLSIYGLGLATVVEAVAPGMLRVALMVGLGLGLFGVLYATISTSNRPWSFFGLELPANWQRALGESALLTVGGMATLTLLAVAIELRTDANLGLFRPPGDSFVAAVVLLGVVLVAGLEELCVRGVLQSALTEVFHEHEEGLLFAIVLSNALFAVAHAAVSANYALLQFAMGLIWGYAYSRQGSLVGVLVARVIVFFFALRMLHLHQLVDLYAS